MAGSVVAQGQRGIRLGGYITARVVPTALRAVNDCEILSTAHKSALRTHSSRGEAVSTAMERRAGATSIRSELWLLRGNLFVSTFGTHIVTETANAGLRDDQLAGGEF